MKKLIAILICVSILLCSCSMLPNGDDEAAYLEASFDEATADEATFDEPTEAPTEPPTEPPSTEELARERLDEIMATDNADVSRSASVSVPEINQYPELPTGCESVAVTIAINAYGYELSKTDFAEKYLVRGDDYITAYVGDPFAYGGAGVFPPGMVKSARKFIKETGASLCAFDISGTKMNELYKLIDNGIPIVVWTTVYMTYPQLQYGREYKGRTYSWYDNEHCVCLYGYDKDEGIVRVSDPQRGKISVNAKDFGNIYDVIGRFAMVLIDTSGLEG